jgi:hypothetical protein
MAGTYGRMGRPTTGEDMDSDLSEQARIVSDDSDRARRLGSSWPTRIDPADSDHDCIWLIRLTRIWPRCLGSGRAEMVNWVERREGRRQGYPCVRIGWGMDAQHAEQCGRAEFKSLYPYRGNGRQQDLSPSKARTVLRTGPLHILPPRSRLIYLAPLICRIARALWYGLYRAPVHVTVTRWSARP